MVEPSLCLICNVGSFIKKESLILALLFFMLFNTSWVFSLVTYLKRKRGKPRKKICPQIKFHQLETLDLSSNQIKVNFTCHSLSSSSTNLSFSFCWAPLIATFPKVDINIISYHISSYIIYHIYVNVQAIKDSACFHRPM